MNWVVSPAVISGIIGLVSGALGLKKMRSQEHAQAELRWKQAPLSPWRYETLTMVAVTIHSLGLIGIVGLLLWSVSGFRLFTSPPGAGLFLLSILAMFSVFFTSYVTGVMIAYHMAQPWIRPASYGMSEAGLMYGGSLVEWKSYSHYEIGPDDGLISLYSSYCPQLRTWVLQPPPELFASVLGLIQKHVSHMPPTESSSTLQRSPLALILQMAALVVAAILPALWGLSRGQAWVWIYALLAFFVVHYFGIQLITRFDGRAQSPDPTTT
ncbi:MAG TPA: hypothetical protein VFY26_11250 [Anaerolineales bacterium]|nr:hypothetical protein [Anaerolineales bacterium]